MRRTVLILPGLLSLPEGDSLLRQGLPALSNLCERGTFSKVAPIPESDTPESMVLGMSPNSVRLNQGPLTVSALGFDPPERSTHFHLSLMSFCDGIVSKPTLLATQNDVDVILSLAKRLDTKLLTVLKGESFDHALVWEALGDLGTSSAVDADGKLMKEHLPQGDGETTLRRFIDDSINLLTDLELNERRIDAGLPPFNLLWPWGQGVRTPVPNLALGRGEPAIVESGSMRLAGLTRLAGYKHTSRAQVGRGLGTKLRLIADRATKRSLSIVYLDVAEALRREGKLEELEWFVRELDRELLAPLLDDHIKTPSRLTVIAPGTLESFLAGDYPASPIGLSVSSETGHISHNIYPFDERCLEEKTVPARDLWALVSEAIE